MNKEELRKKYKEQYSGPEYSYVKKEDKELEMKVHDLLVDIVTNHESNERFCDMFKEDYLTRAIIRKISNDFEIFLDFESTLIHNDILDDCELHVLYDLKTNKWFLDKTYDFLDYVEEICKKLNLDINNVQVASIDGWRRNTWKHIDGTVCTTLGLEDFVIILECVKNGNLNDLKNKIPLNSLKKMVELYNRE